MKTHAKIQAAYPVILVILLSLGACHPLRHIGCPTTYDPSIIENSKVNCADHKETLETAILCRDLSISEPGSHNRDA